MSYDKAGNAVAPFVAQMKKGGYGNPTDERRNTQLAIKLVF